MVNYDVLTRDVWEDNFDEEISIIRNSIIINYPVVSLSIHFPTGADRVPTGIAWGNSAANYSALLQTMNRETSTQVGLAFADRKGELSCCSKTGRPCVWQFNLTPPDEPSDPEREGGSSKRLLDRVGPKKGINPCRLAAGLWRCNLLMNDDIIWVVFKGGLDFLALLRWVRLSVQGLPLELDEFLRLQRLYFPAFHDIAAAWRFHPLLGDDGTIHVLARSFCLRMEEMPPSRPASDCLLALRLLTALTSVLWGTFMLKNNVNVIFGLTAGEEADYALPTLSNVAPV